MIAVPRETLEQILYLLNNNRSNPEFAKAVIAIRNLLNTPQIERLNTFESIPSTGGVDPSGEGKFI